MISADSSLGSTLGIYTFNIVDTTIVINNPNTYSSLTPVTGTITTTPLPTTNSISIPQLYGYMIGTYINNSVVDTILSVIYDNQGVYDTVRYPYGIIRFTGIYYISTQFYWYTLSTLRSSSTGTKYIIASYIYIDFANMNKGVIVVNKSNATTSISTIESKVMEILVVPNPFTTSTKVFINSTYTNVIVKLMNIAGTDVFKQNVTNDVVEINRESLSSGMYFLQVISNDKIVATEKVIIQ